MQDPAGVHQRGLWRPVGASAAGDYWGNVNPIGSASCYDEGKRCAETLFFDYHRQHGLEIKVARIFNTYGPRMHPSDGRVVSNFIVQALRNEPITLYGDGEQTRSFCYVDDLVDGLIRLMDTPGRFHRPGQPRQSDGVHHSRARETDPELTGRRSRISSTCRCRRTTRSSAGPTFPWRRAQLGWQPRVALEEGLKPTIGYFMERLADDQPSVPKRGSVAEQRRRLASAFP